MQIMYVLLAPSDTTKGTEANNGVSSPGQTLKS